jgi:hypothetical protein
VLTRQHDGTGLVTVSPGAKKAIGLLGGVLVLYFVISDPQGSSALVQDIGGMLRDGADSLVTFIRSLFA